MSEPVMDSVARATPPKIVRQVRGLSDKAVAWTFIAPTIFLLLAVDALIEVSKNIKDSEEISGLLNSFKESKKSNTDLRRTGLVTLFTGIGLAALGKFGLSLDVLFGVGLLVMFIGFGQIIAGYVYPNTGSELTNAVDDFEKK